MLTLQFLKLDENLLNSGIIEKEKFVMNNYFDFVNIYTIAGFMPVALILATVILKIYFSKKFKNELFYAILIILLLYSSAVYSIIFFMTAVQDNSTFLQHNNIALGGFLTSLYPSVFVVSVLILVIMVTGTTIYYVKTKDKTVIKKFEISFIILAFVIYLGLPVIIASTPVKTAAGRINMYKTASDTAIIPALRGYYAGLAAMNIFDEIINKYKRAGKFPDYSSIEAKTLINEYLKYKTLEADLTNYDNYLMIAIFCLNVEEPDKAIEYAEKAKFFGAKTDGILASAYIAKDDYSKAYEYAMKTNNPSFYLVKIYTAENKFDEALKELEKEKNKKTFYNRAKAYIYYKSGKDDLALKYKEQLEQFKDYSLAEFVSYIDRTEF